MSLKLELNAMDVTQLPDSRGDAEPDDVPLHKFEIAHDGNGYRLEFDGNAATVPANDICDLLQQVATTTSTDWKHSSDPEIQATFRPLNRILQRINSTPTYQLFLSGFHIGDTIGLFDLEALGQEAIADSFRYLVGNLPWHGGKKGRLFILPEGYVASTEIRRELMANGKIFCADFWVGVDDRQSHIESKDVVPYATPIGFNTRVSNQTKEAWRRICDLVRRNSGEPIQ